MTNPQYPPETLAIILFGSHARGDNDGSSDQDFCVIVEDVSFQRFIEIKAELSCILKTSCESVSIYLRETTETMASEGSLFIHHLQAEGQLIFDRRDWVPSLYSYLHRFENHLSQLSSYRELLDDLIDDSASSGLLECELHLLQMLVRNTAIVMCSSKGVLNFGRTSAFAEAKSKYPDAPFDDQIFRELTDWHLTYERGVQTRVILPSLERQKEYIENVDSLLLYCVSCF